MNREEVLRKWLAIAREKLDAQDYTSFGKAMRDIRDTGGGSRSRESELAVLNNIADLLWRAEFREGHRAHTKWLLDFTGLPQHLLDVWPNAVRCTSPAPISPRGTEAKDLYAERTREDAKERSAADTSIVAMMPVPQHAPQQLNSLGAALQIDPGMQAATRPSAATRASAAMTEPPPLAAPTDGADNSTNILSGESCDRSRAKSKRRLEPEVQPQIPQKLPLCVMCQQVPTKPKVAVLCGHFACSDCWDSWLTQKFECPVCRKKARPANLIALRGWGDG